ncbi:hypothetical protein QBC35DRAFT_498256 [Podospora australis]|uniref:TauD/TfdA-like domain-containing protein n=1 Tax=Podospora australis TaxID=1536484 RepID=A0AAN6WU25_9PEZI|nr:hypothetical protein QBC35DRAFT_498256 [Podospora australis]
MMRRSFALDTMQAAGLRLRSASASIAATRGAFLVQSRCGGSGSSFLPATATRVAHVPRRYNHDAASSEYSPPLPICEEPGKNLQAPKFTSVKLTDKSLILSAEGKGDGDKVRHFELSQLWLRDACNCSRCVDPHSGQKTFATTKLIYRPSITKAELDTDGNLTVHWIGDVLSKDNNGHHVSLWTREELALACANGRPRIQLHPPVQRTLWDQKTMQAMLDDGSCRVDYADWMREDGSSEAFWRAFETLCRTGLIMVQGVPSDEKSVERIASRIGQLQHTFYGWTWDVKNKPQAENVAYTNQFLGLHQDLQYHNPIPRLQLLHCLANECDGGESLFSDGLLAAAEIERKHLKIYQILKNTNVEYGYEKGGHHYAASRPVIGTHNRVYRESIHWAPPFQTTFRTNDPYLPAWVNAANVFQRSIEAPDRVLQVKLQEGECVIFDNHRVLHGRNEFATGGEKNRWLKGTYISPQVFRAKETQLQRRLTAADTVWAPYDQHKRWELGQSEVQAAIDSNLLPQFSIRKVDAPAWPKDTHKENGVERQSEPIRQSKSIRQRESSTEGERQKEGASTRKTVAIDGQTAIHLGGEKGVAPTTIRITINTSGRGDTPRRRYTRGRRDNQEKEV